MCVVVKQSLIHFPGLLYSTVNLTNTSYFVQLERRRGSDGSGSSNTSLENLDEDFSSDEESPRKGKGMLK